MRTDSPAGVHGRPDVGSAAPAGVRLLSIDEQPAWTDPALGQFFQQLRQVHGLTRPVLAFQLGTTVAVIDLLEDGRIRSLPPWAETERIVLTYGRLVDMDLGPAARRIRQLTIAADPMVEAAVGGGQVASAWLLAPPPQAAPPGRGLQVVGPPAAGIPTPPRAVIAAAPDRPQALPAPSRRRRARLGPGAWAMVAAAAVAAVVTGVLAAYPGLPVTAATALADSMPESMSRHIRAQRTAVTLRRDADGLTWFETFDPKSRKADKLPSAPPR